MKELKVTGFMGIQTEPYLRQIREWAHVANVFLAILHTSLALVLIHLQI